MSVNLRPLYVGDLQRLRELRNQYREWFGDSGIVTEERHLAWYNSIKGQNFFYIVELEKEIIGTISKKEISTSVYELGNLVLDDKFRGKGYMTNAAKQLIHEGNIYVGRTLPHNKNSQKVFERLGFTNLGVQNDGLILFKLYA